MKAEPGGASNLWKWLALLSFCSAIAWGQLYTGSVTGTVEDPSKALVPNAVVTLTDSDRGIDNTTKTGETGRYLFRSIAPGNYSLHVTAAGFAPYDTSGITLEVNANVTFDVALSIGGA